MNFPNTDAVAIVFGCSPDNSKFYNLDRLKQVKAAAKAIELPIYAIIPVAPSRHNLSALSNRKKQRRAQKELNRAVHDLDLRLTEAGFDQRIDWTLAVPNPLFAAQLTIVQDLLKTNPDFYNDVYSTTRHFLESKRPQRDCASHVEICMQYVIEELAMLQTLPEMLGGQVLLPAHPWPVVQALIGGHYGSIPTRLHFYEIG